jgi:hypothetical protein
LIRESITHCTFAIGTLAIVGKNKQTEKNRKDRNGQKKEKRKTKGEQKINKYILNIIV